MEVDAVPSFHFHLSVCIRRVSRPLCIQRLPRDFPGGPLTRTPSSQCRGPRVPSLVRELDPECYN